MRVVVMKFLCLLTATSFFLLAGCTDDSNPPVTTPPINPPAALALSSPSRIAAGPNGDLVVADYTENRFCLVDKATLEVEKCFVAKGQPSGIAYADYQGGRYFVGNKSVGSVDMFDSQGNFLGHFGGKTNLFGQVNDLALDVDTETVFVLDSKATVVKLFDFDGQDHGFDFGGSDLIRPTALAFIPSTGEILVSDFGDPNSFIDPCPQIRVFNSNLTLNSGLAILGNLGGGGMLGSCDGTGQFSAPQGMTVDSDNNIFLVDALTGTVNVFDFEASRGVPLELDAPIKTLGSLGTGSDQLFYPLDVVVDETTKDVFVADHRNGRITVFAGGGVVP